MLSDDEKRGIYDRFGEQGLKGGGFGGGAPGGMGGMGASDFRCARGAARVQQCGRGAMQAANEAF